MTLDLEELTTGWECPPGELRARAISGRDGEELLQLRIDLGVMQMHPTGRPDGQRYRGLESVSAYIAHETHLGRPVSAEDWEELERELLQLNYRRMTYAVLAETALENEDQPLARRRLAGALRDIEACQALMEQMRARGNRPDGYSTLQPTLLFDQARLAAQLRIVDGWFEDAVEQAEAGVAALTALLHELGYDDEACSEDPGLRYLQELARDLRQEYGVTQTLSEQLAEAIENDDFETAAQLRDQLNRRREALTRDARPE